MWSSLFCLSVFSPYVMSYSVHLSFFSFLSVSRHIPVPIMWDSHFPSLSVFSPYPRIYSVCFSFSTFFSVSRHIPNPTVCVSHFPGFLTFLAIFQVLQCTFIFFHVFDCFSPYSRSYHVRFSFSYFLSFFFAILQVLQFGCLIFHASFDF